MYEQLNTNIGFYDLYESTAKNIPKLSRLKYTQNLLVDRKPGWFLSEMYVFSRSYLYSEFRCHGFLHSFYLTNAHSMQVGESVTIVYEQKTRKEIGSKWPLMYYTIKLSILLRANNTFDVSFI